MRQKPFGAADDINRIKLQSFSQVNSHKLHPSLLFPPCPSVAGRRLVSSILSYVVRGLKQRNLFQKFRRGAELGGKVQKFADVFLPFRVIWKVSPQIVQIVKNIKENLDYFKGRLAAHSRG